MSGPRKGSQMPPVGVRVPAGRSETSQRPFVVIASGVTYNAAVPANPGPTGEGAASTQPAASASPPQSVAASGLFVWPLEADNVMEILPFGTDAANETFSMLVGVYREVMKAGDAEDAMPKLYVPQALASLTVTLHTVTGVANNDAITNSQFFADAIAIDADYSLSPGARTVGNAVKSVVIDAVGGCFGWASISLNSQTAASAGFAARTF